MSVRIGVCVSYVCMCVCVYVAERQLNNSRGNLVHQFIAFLCPISGH